MAIFFSPVQLSSGLILLLNATFKAKDSFQQISLNVIQLTLDSTARTRKVTFLQITMNENAGVINDPLTSNELCLVEICLICKVYERTTSAKTMITTSRDSAKWINNAAMSLGKMPVVFSVPWREMHR